MTTNEQFLKKITSYHDDAYALASYFIEKPITIPRFKFTRELLNSRVFINNKLISFYSQASHIDRTLARISAVCEGYERYCLHLPFHKERTHRKVIKNIDSSYLSLECLLELQGFDDNQFNATFPFKKITSSDQLTWVKAHRLVTKEEVFVPTDFCVLDKNMYFESNSNGCAISGTYESAVRSALLELLERDVFLNFWFKRLAPEFLKIDSNLPKEVRTLLDGFGPYAERIVIFTVPCEFSVPVFFAYIRGNPQAPEELAYIIGAGASLDPGVAIQKALLELASGVHIYGSDTSQRGTYNKYNSFESIQEFTDAIRFYGQYENLKYLQFLFDFEENSKPFTFDHFKNYSTGDIKADLNHLNSVFLKNNLDPIIVDQTQDDIRELGLITVRAFEPRIIDINSAHICRRLGKSRLKQWIKMNPGAFNNAAHPFP